MFNKLRLRLKASILGASTVCWSKAFQRPTTLCEKKYFLISLTRHNISSFSECPLVLLVSCKFSKISFLVCNYSIIMRVLSALLYVCNSFHHKLPCVICVCECMREAVCVCHCVCEALSLVSMLLLTGSTSTGWIPVQLRVLYELVYSARRMGNADIAIRLTSTMFYAMSSLHHNHILGDHCHS